MVAGLQEEDIAIAERRDPNVVPPNSLRAHHARLCTASASGESGAGHASPSPPACRGTIAAIDAGVNTFATVASVDGPPLKLGTGMDRRLLADFGREIDRLETVIKDPWLLKEDRCALSRKIARLRRRAKNVVTDAVHEFSLLLASRYRVVFLPRFRVADMVGGGRLGSTVVRRMLSVGHGKFRSLLVAKAAMYGCTIIEASGPGVRVAVRLFVTGVRRQLEFASVFVLVCVCVCVCLRARV